MFCRLLVQIHDELLLEVEDKDLTQVQGKDKVFIYNRILNHDNLPAIVGQGMVTIP